MSTYKQLAKTTDYDGNEIKVGDVVSKRGDFERKHTITKIVCQNGCEQFAYLVLDTDRSTYVGRDLVHLVK